MVAVRPGPARRLRAGPPMTGEPREGLAFQDTVYAGLDLLRHAFDLHLCALLYRSETAGPQLYMRAPDLGAVAPTDAFLLFSTLREALDALNDPAEREVAGYAALLVPLELGPARGLLACGSEDSRPRAPLEAIVGFAERLRTLLSSQADQASASVVPEVGKVTVESTAGGTLASVELAAGDQTLAGRAEAPSPMRAVASATLEAATSLAADAKLADVAEALVGGERAILVLLADETGRPRLGSELVGESEDTLNAAARASLAALLR